MFSLQPFFVYAAGASLRNSSPYRSGSGSGPQTPTRQRCHCRPSPQSAGGPSPRPTDTTATAVPRRLTTLPPLPEVEDAPLIRQTHRNSRNNSSSHHHHLHASTDETERQQRPRGHGGLPILRRTLQALTVMSPIGGGGNVATTVALPPSQHYHYNYHHHHHHHHNNSSSGGERTGRLVNETESPERETDEQRTRLRQHPRPHQMVDEEEGGRGARGLSVESQHRILRRLQYSCPPLPSVASDDSCAALRPTLPATLQRDTESPKRTQEELEWVNSLLPAPAEGPPFPEASTHCPVCLRQFHCGEDVAELPCGHVFHFCCVGRWLQGNSRCPYCRQDVNDGACGR